MRLEPPAAKRVRATQRDDVLQLAQPRELNMSAKGAGPRRVDVAVAEYQHLIAAFCHRAQALSRVEAGSDLVAEARVDAILDSCARSMPSVRSGLLCYVAFIGQQWMHDRSVRCLLELARQSLPKRMLLLSATDGLDTGVEYLLQVMPACAVHGSLDRSLFVSGVQVPLQTIAAT